MHMRLLNKNGCLWKHFTERTGTVFSPFLSFLCPLSTIQTIKGLFICFLYSMVSTTETCLSFLFLDTLCSTCWQKVIPLLGFSEYQTRKKKSTGVWLQLNTFEYSHFIVIFTKLNPPPFFFFFKKDMPLYFDGTKHMF